MRSYTVSTSTLVVEEAFSSAVDSSVTYELHRYDPTDKHNAINRAIEELYPSLHLRVRDETLVVDDLLSNSDFETFASSAFTGWTEVGSPTTSAETTLMMHGSQSAKVVADSGAAGQLTQAPTTNIREVTSKTATFKCWVYATAADTARIRMDWDGTNFENSDYHSGRDQWELLSVTASVPSDATQVKAICEVAASGTAYFDASWMAVGPVYKYTVPTSIIGGPYTSPNSIRRRTRTAPITRCPVERCPPRAGGCGSRVSGYSAGRPRTVPRWNWGSPESPRWWPMRPGGSTGCWQVIQHWKRTTGGTQPPRCGVRKPCGCPLPPASAWLNPAMRERERSGTSKRTWMESTSSSTVPGMSRWVIGWPRKRPTGGGKRWTYWNVCSPRTR